MDIFDFLLGFTFYYPLFMAYLWIIGAIYYYFHWERNDVRKDVDGSPILSSYPKVSIIVPCYNEGDNIKETIGYLFKQNYKNFEVIAVNDGSSDNTGEILDTMLNDYSNLRVIHLATNQGKAMGLNVGAMASHGEFLVCIDGDAVLGENTVAWMVWHFLGTPRVGAVTGNPRVRTRSTLLGRIQVGEFSAIIGLMKRAQRIYGRIFTVSGVVSGFRKSALHRVGYWDLDMITEDIDISWKLQMDHWGIRYEPNALCWILMPETFRGLWKQRLRWAQGGSEVIFKFFNKMFNYKKRRMWPIFIEYAISVCWSYTMAFVMLIWLVGQFFKVPDDIYIESLLPGWHGVILAITCLIQFAVSLFIDGRYEKGLGRYFYWVIWYPMAYWIINVLTTIVAFPKALFKKKGKRAVWESPDRGLRN